MSAFETYLRTGRRLGAEDVGVEVKFNPWHDPASGRFTFAQGGGPGSRQSPDGSWTGGGFTGGGGGSFGGAGASATGIWGGGGFTGGGGGGGSGGGAGASGTWDAPVTKVKRPAPSRIASPAAGTAAVVRTLSATASASAIGDLTITKNGYSFRIDADGRTREVKGKIAFGSEARSRPAQRFAGGADRLPTDDGGHYIAARFNGPNEVYNHFAQDRGRNRGEYRVMESRWAKAVATGHRVIVDIGPAYVGMSKRPAGLFINVMIDGASTPAYVSNIPRKPK